MIGVEREETARGVNIVRLALGAFYWRLSEGTAALAQWASSPLMPNPAPPDLTMSLGPMPLAWTVAEPRPTNLAG